MQTPTAESTTAAIAAASSPGNIVKGIREAANATGVPFDYLLAQATHESGLDPSARNSRSSASGLFQFTSQTWLDVIRRHGADHGLAEVAAKITRTADGRLDIPDKAVKKAVLDMRKDPALSAMMAGEYARDNAKILERRLGRGVTVADLHLAHLLGAGGAIRVIEGVAEAPRNPADSLLPAAAQANPELFQVGDAREARTVAGLYNSVQARYEHTRSRALVSADLAALRPEPRPPVEPFEASEAADTAPDTTVFESPPQLARLDPGAPVAAPARIAAPVPVEVATPVTSVALRVADNRPPPGAPAPFTAEGPSLRLPIPAAAAAPGDVAPRPLGNRLREVIAAFWSGQRA